MQSLVCAAGWCDLYFEEEVMKMITYVKNYMSCEAVHLCLRSA